MDEERSFAPARPRAFFGGPDRPDRVLRDLLEARIETVPPGGAIDWMTYYFRDHALAAALVRAHRRGVAVRVCLEGWPRRRHANDAVIEILKDSERGLGGGLRVLRYALPLHLHSKLYCFSHPRPTALLGSFNPVGADPSDPELISDIGDQDGGHNLLVEVTDETVVQGLVRRIAAVHGGAGPLQMMTAPAKARIAGSTCDAILFPYLGRNPLDERLAAMRCGETLRIAASHLRDPGFAARLAQMARAGVNISVIMHHTPRRAPPALQRRLEREGVQVFQFHHPRGLPMHCKFVLADGVRPWVAFGSYNFTLTSRWLNQEVLAFSDDPDLWASFDNRWDELMAQPALGRASDGTRTIDQDAQLPDG
jgi:hypothetical protein